MTPLPVVLDCRERRASVEPFLVALVAREGEAMRTSIPRLATIGAVALLLAALAGQAQVLAAPRGGGGPKTTGIHFGTPVRMPTYLSCGGYEPGIALDKFGNIFVTAHKQNHCLALAPDP